MTAPRTTGNDIVETKLSNAIEDHPQKLEKGFTGNEAGSEPASIDAPDAKQFEQTITANDAVETKSPSPRGDDAPKLELETRGFQAEEESEHARIERLGRERPEKFKTLWAEIGFCYSILASQFMAVSFSLARRRRATRESPRRQANVPPRSTSYPASTSSCPP